MFYRPGIRSTFAQVRPRVKIRDGPMVSGFGASGALFQVQGTEELHPQVIKMARKSGQLNLTNRGMKEIPVKVYHINELDNDETRQISLSMDNTGDDKWWEQNDLTRLYLSSNCLSSISPEISNLSSLQILDVSIL